VLTDPKRLGKPNLSDDERPSGPFVVSVVRQSGGLGGGARGTRPMPPTFESQLRAQLEERRDAIRHRAIDIDQYRRMDDNQGGRDA
jgi:hypothetical protein